jgi:hypothetical protein
MEYVKHNYSGRVYQVHRDHGPNSAPHLSSSRGCGRYVRETTLERFFTPCKGPDLEEPTISVIQEAQWEKEVLAKEKPQKPLEAPREKKPQKVTKPSIPKKGSPEAAEYTLKDLCSELGITPAVARKLLRSKGKTAPDGGWRWPNAEAAKGIKKFLKKFL